MADEVGIYFSESTGEVFARRSVNEALPDDAHWIKVHDDPGRGLLAIRDQLAEEGFAADPSSVYWYVLRMSADDVLGHDERPLRRQAWRV